MQWNADRNAGFSRANPQRLYLPVNIDPEYHYETVNVEAQQNNSHSLLWWTKRLIQQRKQFRAFGSGSLEFLYPSNRKVLAFVRQFGDEKVLVVANLSRFTQYVELDLANFQGSVPVEVFGRSKFPSITDQFYLLSLGPHAFYWFHLQPRETTQESLSVSATPQQLPVVRVASVANVFSEATLRALEHIIPKALQSRPWFPGKNRYITGVDVHDIVSLPDTSAHLIFLDVDLWRRRTRNLPHRIVYRERTESRGFTAGPAGRRTGTLGRPCQWRRRRYFTVRHWTVTSATRCWARSFAGDVCVEPQVNSLARTLAPSARHGHPSVPTWSHILSPPNPATPSSITVTISCSSCIASLKKASIPAVKCPNS